MGTQKHTDAARRNPKKANAARDDDDRMPDSHKGSHSSHSSHSRSAGTHSSSSRNRAMDDDIDMDSE